MMRIARLAPWLLAVAAVALPAAPRAVRAQGGSLDVDDVIRRNAEASRPYFECLRQKPAEVELFQRARDVSEYQKMKTKLRALDSRDPQLIAYEAQVDVALAAAFGNYTMAGGAALAPPDVVVPPEPCTRPPLPPGGPPPPTIQMREPFRQGTTTVTPPAPAPRP
jgi:hypothetical protein